ncbi:hypothetical protein ACFPVX_08650 [Cohnella faecalis]|uniref:SMODS and SLOG-associating 2TM effector domain-containing protein n=1 Tax=Cohnella faecalis TaxID=2315694 RepID=A0A398CLB7_9BACL|nr:hypothetical protein [Cohnella faecalis]RIE03012.1 hypothetical protein D3H35_20670 [Cohnella faecalis]
MTDRWSEGNQTLAPILVGVTGHIDLIEEQIPKLRQLVKETLLSYARQYPNTPMILLSPLAAGADQVAAEAALQLRDMEGLQIQLYVPLPMPKLEYLKHFPDEKSVDRFHDLLEIADHHYVIPAVEGIEQVIENRETYYSKVSDHITKYCHILIALWDGIEKSSLKAGTSYTIRSMRDGIESELTDSNKLLDPVTSGIVIRIRTPRQSNPNILKPLTVDEPIYPTNFPFETGQEVFGRILQHIEQFNEDVRREENKRTRTDPSDDTLGWRSRTAPGPLQRIAKLYERCNEFAIRLKKQRMALFRNLLTLAVLLVCFYEFMSMYPFLVAGYAVLLGAAYYQYRRGRKLELHRKFLDYRALAEGLRIQFYWSLSGIEKDVSDFYLSQQRSEVEWICSVIRSQHYLNQAHRVPKYDHLQWVKDNWIGKQYMYFVDSARNNQEKGMKSAARFRLLFVSGVLLIFSIYAGNLFFDWFQMTGVASWLLIPAASLVAYSIAYNNYSQQQSYSYIVAEHSRMATLFEYGLKKTNEYLNAEKPESARKVILKLGQEVLDENGSWVYMNRERDIHLPTGF